MLMNSSGRKIQAGANQVVYENDWEAVYPTTPSPRTQIPQIIRETVLDLVLIAYRFRQNFLVDGLQNGRPREEQVYSLSGDE